MEKRKVAAGIIAQAGAVALVQWKDDGALQRTYVPTAEIVKGRCAVDVLNAGIPYGAPWEEILEKILSTRPITADALADSLRAHNIWTGKDVESNPRGAKRAIDAIVGVTIGELRRAALVREEAKNA